MRLVAVVGACSPEDAAAQARHVGRADGLEQEILGAFLQAPDAESSIIMHTNNMP